MTDNHKSSPRTQGNKQWQSHKHFIIALISNYMTHADAKSQTNNTEKQNQTKAQKKQQRIENNKKKNQIYTRFLYEWVHCNLCACVSVYVETTEKNENVWFTTRNLYLSLSTIISSTPLYSISAHRRRCRCRRSVYCTFIFWSLLYSWVYVPKSYGFSSYLMHFAFGTISYWTHHHYLALPFHRSDFSKSLQQAIRNVFGVCKCSSVWWCFVQFSNGLLLIIFSCVHTDHKLAIEIAW